MEDLKLIFQRPLHWEALHKSLNFKPKQEKEERLHILLKLPQKEDKKHTLIQLLQHQMVQFLHMSLAQVLTEVRLLILNSLLQALFHQPIHLQKMARITHIHMLELQMEDSRLKHMKPLLKMAKRSLRLSSQPQMDIQPTPTLSNRRRPPTVELPQSLPRLMLQVQLFQLLNQL
jgi:hypothetical protein